MEIVKIWSKVDVLHKVMIAQTRLLYSGQLMIYLVLDMQMRTIGCVNGVYGVFPRLIIGFDSLLFETYNVRMRCYD